MEQNSPSTFFRVPNFFFFFFFFILSISVLELCSCSTASKLHPSAVRSISLHRNYTAVSEFRVVNRRALKDCPDKSPYLKINVTSGSVLSDSEFVTLNVTGVLEPAEGDWVAMISPSTSDVSTCLQSAVFYIQTGDLSSLPLLCHYPVKAQYMSKDPDYLSCKKQECQKHDSNGKCSVTTCGGSLKFHVVNFRTDVEFVLFGGGFATPCLLQRTNNPLHFANPNKPLYAHISTVDSTATAMRITWVSGDKKPQQVLYGQGKSETSKVTTFSQKDMCSAPIIPSPAKDFGWHDPGFIHTAVMTGLQPSSTFSYKYGSDLVGWSEQIQFKTPPAGGRSDATKFLVYGDMGKAPLDDSAEHYIQPGSLSVVKAMTGEVNNGSVDSIFHIGDISYATGFLVEWDYFLQLINPLASRVSYMTAIGNHERDYIGTGSKYIGPDSGGECGVPYETYFPMPTPAKDKPWYSVEQASVHITVVSTEHDWTKDSEQYGWIQKDLASVDRSKTPWLVFMGHRPMYSSCGSSDDEFVRSIEPLLLQNKVDLVLFGHVHNYERTCSIYQSQCLSMPTKDANGIDTYDHNNYTAPVHAIVGMAGFKLDQFPDDVASWSLTRIAKFGYLRAQATKDELKLEFVVSDSMVVEDSFRITKTQKKHYRKNNS